MNEILSFSVCMLSATQAWGGVATLLLFIVCFVAVHAVKLSSKGYALYKKEQQKKTTPTTKKQSEKPPEPQQEKTPQTPPAPVYYLVEKKRIRKKPVDYADPQRIRLENDERR